MPTIVAICPYCRAGGVRASQASVGASATCPKCKSSFTVMPSEGLPGWAKELESASSSRRTAPDSAPPTDETKPVAAMGMADVTEPSPILTAEERVRFKPSPQTDLSPASEAEAVGTAEPTDMGLVVALIALSFVGIAVLVSQVSYGRFAAVGLAAVGLIGGLASVSAEGRTKLVGVFAVVMNLFVLVMVLLLPSWLNLEPWRGPGGNDVPAGPSVMEHRTGLQKAIAPTEWIDASHSSWEFGDVRVTVRSAFVGPVQLRGPKDAKRTTKDQYFQLLMRVANTGVERQLDLSGWAAGHGLDSVRVSDSTGKLLKPAAFDDGWVPDRGKPTEKVFPGKSSDVRLIFAVPADKLESLRVQLPAACVGMPGEEIKFRIGSHFLTRNGPPN